ncbi:DNA polymerase III subunit delta [Pseudoroseicyclus aestuarii]|uniref:DNA-directed DNA polymerase n=1 Tax=Pseudoroseicyclus aestuarii TaxID=1795041 RepID=A0A318SUX1_9RHOB|nr:DNA polymerase III subunit delta [Pseudoroseicyclus aestuarii]PYE83667.1 DNA polymerase III delta subunit [Pseudoroseicyclus aestuarii]
MKLSTRDAAAWIKRPDAKAAGALLYGGDAMRVSDKRRALVLAMTGPEAEAEMRLTRLTAADLRSDPSQLEDAMRAQGFFPGPRAVTVDGATDGLADLIGSALSGWQPGDAQLVVTAGSLPARSALRKLFEGQRAAVAIALYDDPPSGEEIGEMLQAAGLNSIASEARAALGGLSKSLDPGDFRQTIEKLGLYMHGEAAPVTPEDIAAVAPRSAEAEMDDLLTTVADSQVDGIAPLLARLYAQGVQPVTLCIMALRHFRALHAAASDPGGAASGVAKLRPPVFGPRRDVMIRQAGRWRRERLEQAIAVLLDTDLSLRMARPVPPQALVERALIRLAMLQRGPAR